MEPIFLPALARAPQQTEVIPVKTEFAELETLTAVQGQMTVVHHGNYLQVDGTAETIVTLTCDRCLQQYNHRLEVQASELIWLQEATAEDALSGVITAEDLEDPDLIETLPPNGYFQPEDWLYQQLCLELPQRQLCDTQCPGIPIAATTQATPPSIKDQRWAALANLKQQLSNESA